MGNILSLYEFWGENYYGHPPLTESVLRQAERTLAVRLPPLLVELLFRQNGGYTQGFIYPVTQKTSWSDDHVPFDELFGIVTDERLDSAQNLLDSEYLIREWGLPERQVLLSGNGPWWISLDYRYRDSPAVRWIDVDCGEEILLTENFTAFVSELKPVTKK